jgi:uncharacterized RDD family membrane protein YckC
LRCGKCQRRLSDGNARSSSENYPVIDSAAAPALDFRQQEFSETASASLTAVHSNPEMLRRSTLPTQPALFPYRDGRKVVRMGENGALAARARSADVPRAPRRKVNPGQTAFDFEAADSRPFAHELDRRDDCSVAPLQLRAMAAVFDAGLVVGFFALFLLTVRLTLGHLPMGKSFYICYGFGLLLIAMIYKLMFCAFGQVTLGLQGARLEVVSYDGQPPTRSQCFVRMFSGWLSLASAGMGVLWALADQDHLSWHDHVSQTFLTHRYPRQEFAD